MKSCIVLTPEEWEFQTKIGSIIKEMFRRCILWRSFLISCFAKIEGDTVENEIHKTYVKGCLAVLNEIYCYLERLERAGNENYSNEEVFENLTSYISELLGEV